MGKKSAGLVHTLKLEEPVVMEYYVTLDTDKAKRGFINRVKRIVRGMDEYRDYVKFLKEHVGLESCIFFQNIVQPGKKSGRISIEMHHEPFTLEDYIKVVIKRYEMEGLDYDDLLIADEVVELHYANQVGLVPVSKTAHQMIHSSNKMNTGKLIVPLNMVYGEYSEFINKYYECIEQGYPELIDKLEDKINQTKELTEESFSAILRQFTYIDMENVEEVEKFMDEDATETNAA